MPDDRIGQGEEMVRRARGVAAGLADVGLTQAEELLRRLSPEGRAQARREKEARARRQKRLLLRLALASVASLLAWAVLAAFLVPGAALAIAAAMMVFLGALIIARADPTVRGRAALAEAGLPDLAAETTIWLAAQRRGLPAPAVQLADTLSRRLDELAPQAARLDPRSPAADAVRKLIATELPDLVEGWRAVPIHRRSLPQADGRTPDAQLTDGLRLIDAELARMTDQLAGGTLDAVTVQGRYLELKYGDGRPG
ncbi:hypothetical protein ACT009_15300 [Sphingomonas sp. Tas61C01]|uniref:hypothetical protein n=1 Tax=Sphingomonas sp. Tas61C01 TaxID=3458297 RepID=UPI00403EC5AD